MLRIPIGPSTERVFETSVRETCRNFSAASLPIVASDVGAHSDCISRTATGRGQTLRYCVVVVGELLNTSWKTRWVSWNICACWNFWRVTKKDPRKKFVTPDWNRSNFFLLKSISKTPTLSKMHPFLRAFSIHFWWVPLNIWTGSKFLTVKLLEEFESCNIAIYLCIEIYTDSEIA